MTARATAAGSASSYNNQATKPVADDAALPRSQEQVFKDWMERYVQNANVSAEEMARSIESEAKVIALEMTPLWVPSSLVPILTQPVSSACPAAAAAAWLRNPSQHTNI